MNGTRHSFDFTITKILQTEKLVSAGKNLESIYFSANSNSINRRIELTETCIKLVIIPPFTSLIELNFLAFNIYKKKF